MPVAGDEVGDHMSASSLAVIPDSNRAIDVLPEDVGVAVAIEVASAGNMPTAWHRASDVPAGGLTIIPDPDRAVVVLPENVGLTIAVEVAGADDMPVAGGDANT